MNWIKAYAAGMIFGATIYPFLWLFLAWKGHPAAQSPLLHGIILFMPIICGCWNILYFTIFEVHPVRNRTVRLWGHGAILGLMMVVPFISLIGFENILFGTIDLWKYAQMPFVPIVWGFIWLYLTGFFNDQFGLEDK